MKHDTTADLKKSQASYSQNVEERNKDKEEFSDIDEFSQEDSHLKKSPQIEAFVEAKQKSERTEYKKLEADPDEQLVFENNEEVVAFLENKSKRIKNSRINNITKAIGYYLVVIGLLVAYFIGDYASERIWRDQFINVITHLRAMLSLIPEIRYGRVYMLEEMAMDNIWEVFRADSKCG